MKESLINLSGNEVMTAVMNDIAEIKKELDNMQTIIKELREYIRLSMPKA